jgi:hypothetical protein
MLPRLLGLQPTATRSVLKALILLLPDKQLKIVFHQYGVTEARLFATFQMDIKLITHIHFSKH